MSFISKAFKKIKGKHKVLVYLPKRGGRRLLFTTQVNDVDEIKSVVLSELENYKDDRELKEYKYVIAVDTKEDTEVKISNPFFEESEEEEQNKKVDLKEYQQALQMDIIDTLHEAYKNTIPQLLSSIITSTTNVSVGIVKDMLSSLVEEKTKRTQWGEIASLIWGVVELARNWDQVKKMSNELAPMMKDFIQKGEIPKELKGK
jgi:hypothetical protein